MGEYMTLSSVPMCNLDDERMARLTEIARQSQQKDDGGYLEQPEEWKEHLIKAVVFLKDAHLHGDTCHLGIPGGEYELLLSGGMSQGDSPTDAHDYFYTISQVEELWNQLCEWAKADKGQI